jgi:hypothetical protein
MGLTNPKIPAYLHRFYGSVVPGKNVTSHFFLHVALIMKSIWTKNRLSSDRELGSWRMNPWALVVCTWAGGLVKFLDYSRHTSFQKYTYAILLPYVCSASISDLRVLNLSVYIRTGTGCLEWVCELLENLCRTDIRDSDQYAFCIKGQETNAPHQYSGNQKFMVNNFWIYHSKSTRTPFYCPTCVPRVFCIGVF